MNITKYSILLDYYNYFTIVFVYSSNDHYSNSYDTFLLYLHKYNYNILLQMLPCIPCVFCQLLLKNKFKKCLQALLEVG